MTRRNHRERFLAAKSSGPFNGHGRACNPKGDSAVLLHGVIHHRDRGRARELTHLSACSRIIV